MTSTVDALQYGEVVDITITGAKVSGPIADRLLIGFGDDTLQLTVGNPHVTITRSEPADGEPQQGDVWRDQEGRAYACVWRDGRPVLVDVILRPGNERLYVNWLEVHKGRSGPIRLVYRLTDDPASAS